MSKRQTYREPTDDGLCRWCSAYADEFCLSCGGCTFCCKPGEPSCIGGELPVEDEDDA